jgi:hypothetical protein
VALLKEEMRRVLAYFEYKAKWWEARADGGGREMSEYLTEGVRAFAKGQARLQRDLAAKFLQMWVTVRDESANSVGEQVGEVEDSEDELEGAGEGSEEEDFDEEQDDEAGMEDEEFTYDD